jgi:hypothetical protein
MKFGQIILSSMMRTIVFVLVLLHNAYSQFTCEIVQPQSGIRYMWCQTVWFPNECDVYVRTTVPVDIGIHCGTNTTLIARSITTWDGLLMSNCTRDTPMLFVWNRQTTASLADVHVQMTNKDVAITATLAIVCLLVTLYGCYIATTQCYWWYDARYRLQQQVEHRQQVENRAQQQMVRVDIAQAPGANDDAGNANHDIDPSTRRHALSRRPPNDASYVRPLDVSSIQTPRCCICMDRQPDMLIRPCNHLCLCQICSAALLRRCPQCRVAIRTIERIYVS